MHLSSLLWREAENRSIVIQASLGKKQNPILKKIREKRSGGWLKL
jgi:hypothetical protein